MSIGGGVGNFKRGVFYHVVVDLDEIDDVGHGVHYHGNEWERLDHADLDQQTRWNVIVQQKSAHNNDEESGHTVNIGLGLNGQNYYH
jgi:hypothetical protein